MTSSEKQRNKVHNTPLNKETRWIGLIEDAQAIILSLVFPKYTQTVVTQAKGRSQSNNK